MPLHQVPLVFLDVETTGLSPRKGDRMVEICARRLRGGALEAELDTLVDPGREIPAEASRIHGIDAAAVAGAPGEAEVVARLDALLRGAVLVAHNAPFDRFFVDDALRRQGRAALAREPLDTLAMSRRLWLGARGGHSLGALARRLGIVNPAPHRAAGDVQVLIEAWPRLLEAIDSERRPLTCLGDLEGFVQGRCERETARHAAAEGHALGIVYLAARGRIREAVLERFEVAGDELVAGRLEAGRLAFARVLRARVIVG